MRGKRKSIKFTPNTIDALERREFLSTMPSFAGPVPVHREALIRRLSGFRPVSAAPQRTTLVERVERSFDSFAQDYRQARGIFLGSLNQNGGESAPATLSAFETYTVQRVNLLAEELVGEIQHAAIGASGKKGDAGLGTRAFVTTQINRLQPVGPNGGNPVSRVAPARGTLLRGLLDPLRIDPLAGANSNGLQPIDPRGEATSLIILAQDSAIQAAQSSILNGVQTYRRLFSGR